jgi:hypothetical protein
VARERGWLLARAWIEVLLFTLFLPFDLKDDVSFYTFLLSLLFIMFSFYSIIWHGW